MNEADRLPVVVLTGFLGSGKTTLLNALLRRPELGDSAVIVNEFGEIGIDHALIASSNEDTILLDSGCLCCTVRGDLVDTLRDLSVKRLQGEVPPFARVLIETTGLADPAPILHTLMSQPVARRFRLGGVVTTVDAVNGLATLNHHGEAVKQAAVADRLVLTKTDLAPDVAALNKRLDALNPSARRIAVDHGAVDPALLLDGLNFDPEAKPEQVRAWLAAEAFDHDHEHHHHDSAIGSFGLFFDEPLDWRLVSMWLDFLVSRHGDRLLRVKGILNIADESAPVVVHSVQHLFHPPARLPAWPDADHRSRLVFIARDLGRAEVEQALADIRSVLVPQEIS